jgi:hypothetical protein
LSPYLAGYYPKHFLEETKMSKTVPFPKAKNLSNLVQHRLNSYALAATAAGVGALAVSQPVEAKVIYTPANISVHGGTKLYLNNGPHADFEFCESTNISSCFGEVAQGPQGFVWELKIKPVDNGVAIRGTGSTASALGAGVVIETSAGFVQGHDLMAECVASAGTTCHGPWKKVTNRYLGLQFKIGGKIHYGWARLTTNWAENSATVTGYAYQSIANQSILTGQTTDEDGSTDRTLGALALGRK